MVVVGCAGQVSERGGRGSGGLCRAGERVGGSVTAQAVVMLFNKQAIASLNGRHCPCRGHALLLLSHSLHHHALLLLPLSPSC